MITDHLNAEAQKLIDRSRLLEMLQLAIISLALKQGGELSISKQELNEAWKYWGDLSVHQSTGTITFKAGHRQENECQQSSRPDPK